MTVEPPAGLKRLWRSLRDKSPRQIVDAARYRACIALDFLRFARLSYPYKRLLPAAPGGRGILLVSGNGMNYIILQLWLIFTVPMRLRGYRIYATTFRGHGLRNRYLRWMRVACIYLDDVPDSEPADAAAAIRATRTFEEVRRYSHEGAPIGEIALSTYSRNFGTGIIDVNDPAVLDYVHAWMLRAVIVMAWGKKIFARHDIEIVFCSEVFMEEYGALYYAAITSHLNVVRQALTVRDDSVILQHLSLENDRIHHSSIAHSTWEAVKRRNDDALMETELKQNFSDRYGNKWHRSKRNHPNTKILDPAQARQSLGIAADRKVAIIYSHILYDTLFFFGTDLFRDYSQWLLETVRAAIKNPGADWLIKIHPSNLWRGEIDNLLKGEYEEERLLRREFGDLPPHVRIVKPTTDINPYTWFQLADYGITVRGTSGLEMAALGKTVITAGTGRYEGNGFTIDPPTAGEYLDILSRIHELPPLSPEQERLAKRYAHAVFALKPYTITSIKPALRSCAKQVLASDDLTYLPVSLGQPTALGHDLQLFADWVQQQEERDLLSDYKKVTR